MMPQIVARSPRDAPADGDHPLLLATSALQLQLYRLTGDQLERGVARLVASWVIQEYQRGLQLQAERAS